MAKVLAKIYGVNVKKAEIAGLLHDCAKTISNDEKERLLSLMPSIGEMLNQGNGLAHAPLGAAMAKVDFKIDDDEIFDAIYYHTVGKPNMSTLAKIVYVADMIEINRDKEYPFAKEIRKVAKVDLDKALLLVVVRSMYAVLEKGVPLHILSVQLYNSIVMGDNNGQN